MDNATIGDGAAPLYQFEWDDGRTRTSDEIGDLDAAGFDFTVEEIVDIGRDDPDCEVRIIGFAG